MFELFSDVPLATGARVACVIEYDGAQFSGWQAQPHLSVDTVQETVEQALSRVANAPVRVHCAGRTDAGVHACGQVVHFDAPAVRSPRSWVIGGNSHLPATVRLHSAQAVSHDFHARFSALARRYLYCIVEHPVRPASLVGRVTWVRQVLDEGAMNTAAQALRGEQDFSAFRAAACQSRSRHRNVHNVAVYRRGRILVIDITANAFLLHMVRNIAGSLLEVGKGRRNATWIADLLAGRDRTLAAETAPADGLYLAEVMYSGEFSLPGPPFRPFFMDDDSGNES